MSLPAGLPVGFRRVGYHRQAGTVPPCRLAEVATALLAGGWRLAVVSGHDDGDSMRAVYLFTAGPPDARVELHVPLERTCPSVPTLAMASFPASRFERELQDLFGIEARGHPEPRRLVLHQHWPEGWHPMAAGAGEAPQMLRDAASFPFVPVEGAGVYEIPVGPVHAGLIEPGHFRFWVLGETILRMDARLWFLHKGTERLLEGKDVASGLAVAERISGDSAVGHALAYCQAVEDARRVRVSCAAQVLRGLLLELERLYNHVADVGSLCNDVGFGLAQARALLLRERLLQLNEELTGHRLLRGGVVPGGARLRRLPSEGELAELAERLEELVELVGSNALVLERFAGTATLEQAPARELGVVGVVARASGVGFDARVAHPFVDPPAGFAPAIEAVGDVRARYEVRVAEARACLVLLSSYARRAEGLEIVTADKGRPASDPAGGGVGIVEGWRGAIVHRVELDGSDRIRRLKVVDPSFFNWPALSVALADTIVPDFPLANKSFNLSYAGNDL